MSKRQGLLAKAGVDLEGPTQVVVDREANEQQELVAPCAEPSPPAVELGRVQDLVGNHVVGLALTGDLVDGFEGVVRGEVAQALVAQGPVESVFSSNTAMLRAMGAAHEGDPDTAFRSARDSSGRPLPPAVQRRMERLLGHDFEHVRIHTDTPAHVASKAIYARAWTRGHDIYFGRGEWHPGSNGGTALLAHELTHVVQHDEGRLPTRSAGGPRVSSPSDPVEREAHQVEQDALVAMVDGLLDAPTVDGPLDARTSDGVLQAPRAEGVLPGPPIHSADMPVHRKEDKKKDATTKKKKDDKDDPAARLDKVCKLLDEVRPSCLAAAKAIDQVDWSGWRSAAAAVASALVRVEQDRKDLSSILGFDTSELEKKLRDPVLVAAFHPVTFKGRPVVPAKVLPVIGENVGKWAKARQAAMEKLFAAAGKLRHQPPPGYRQNHPDTWRDWKAQPHHYAPPGSYNSEQLRELAGRLRAELAPFGGRDWLYLAQALSDKETLIDPRIKKLVLADAGSQLLVAQFSEGLQGSLDPDSAAGRIWAQVDLVGRAALTLRGAIDRLDAAAWLNGATALVEQVTGVERSIKELRTTPGVSEREVGMVERKLQMDGRILSAFYPSFVPDGSGGLRPTVGFLPRAGTGAMSTRLFSRLGSVYLMIASLPELEKEISTILPRYGTRINRDGDRVNTFVSPEVDVRKVIDKRLMGMSGRDRMWVLSHLLSSQSLSADQKAALIKSSDDAHRRLVKEELTPKPGSDKPKDPTSPAGRLWSNVEALAASSGKARDAFESVDVKEWVAGSAATIRKAEGLDKGLDGLAKSDPKAAAPVTRKLAQTRNILMAFHPQAYEGKALGPWIVPPSRIPLAPEMRVQQSAMTKLARAAVQVQAKGQSTGKLGLTAFIPSEGSAYGTIREIEGLLSPWRGRNWLFLFEALRATQVDPTLLSIVGRSRSMQIRIDVAERKGVSADELKRVKETFEQLRTLLAQVEVPRQGEKPSSNLLSCRPTLVTLVSLYHGEARGVLFRMLRDANLYQKLFHVIGFQKFNGLRNNAGKDWSGPLGDQKKNIRDKTILDGAEYSGISALITAYHTYGSFRDFGMRGLGFLMGRSDVAAAALRHFQEQDRLVVSGSGLDSKDAMRAMIWGQIVGQGLISTALPFVTIAEDVHSMVTGYQLGLRGQQEGKLSTTDRVLAGFNILCSAATTLKGMKNTPQFFNEPAIQKSLKALEFLQQTVNVGQPVTMMLVSASKNGWDHPDTLQAMFQLGHMGAMHFGQKHLVRRKKSNRFPKAGIPRKPGSNSEVIREGGPRWKQGKGRSPIPEDSRVPKNGTKKETAVIGKHPDTAPKKHQTPKRSTGPDHLETKPKSLKHGDHVVIDGKPGRWQVMEGEDGKVRVYRFDEYGTHVKLVDPAKLRHAPSAMSPKDVLKVRSFLKEMRNVDPALDGIARLFESGDLSVESVPLAQILKRWDSSGLHFPGSKRVKVGVLEHINDAKTDANIYRILEQIRRMNLPEGEVREFTRSIAAKVILAHELQHAAYQKEDFNKKLDAMRLDPKHPKLPHTTLAPSRQLRLNEYRSYRVEVQVERYLMWKAHERATEHWKSLGCPKGLEPRKPDYPPPGKDLGARWYQEIRRLSATHPEVQRLGQTEATMPLPKP